MTIAKGLVANRPVVSLAVLLTISLLRSSGAFLAPSTAPSAPAVPANKRETEKWSSVASRFRVPDDGRSPRPGLSTFGGGNTGLAWGRGVGKKPLPGWALSATVSSSFLAGESEPDKEEEEEQKRSVAMASTLVERGAHDGGAKSMDIEESEGGGEEEGKGRGARGRWKNGWRKTRGKFARIFKHGDSQAAGGGDPQQQGKEVAAATSAAEASSLGSQVLPPGDKVVPQAVAEFDIGDAQQQSGATPGDGGFIRPQRILILMSDTGGGHLASAQALKEAFGKLYLGMINVSIVDIWTQHAPFPLNKIVASYGFMAKRPFIWKAVRDFGRFPPTRKIAEECMYVSCHKRFRVMFEAYKPDLVMSVHPLCQEVPLRALQNMGGGKKDTPFVTVVTELGEAHPTWFHPDVDACFVPGERLASPARRLGPASDKVLLRGLPIRSGFWRRQSAENKTKLQKKLGLEPGVNTCLVVGGGDGVGRLEGIANSVGCRLGQEDRESQVVVVCGKNEALKASLESVKWPSNVHMHVKGFVSNMDEWMGAVDCIVTKAGPGTIAEATARGLPMLISGFLPGREKANVPYIIDEGFGTFSTDPTEIADIITGWLGDDHLLAWMGRNSQKASRPMATFQICRDIEDMLFFRGASVESPKWCFFLDASIMDFVP